MIYFFELHPHRQMVGKVDINGASGFDTDTWPMKKEIDGAVGLVARMLQCGSHTL